MPRLLVLLLAFSLFSTTLYGQEVKKASSAVKVILDQAVAEVKRNRQEFDKANEKPLADAREELQGLFQKLVDGGKSEDAQAVVKQMETLQADVLRMASGGEKPTLKPAVKTILEKALREVRKNRDAFDKANQEPLGSARRQLQELAKQQAGEGKTKDASASLQQIETLTRDVMRLAEAPAPTSPDPATPPRPTPGRDGEMVWKGHRYKVIRETLAWHDSKKRCEELGGHLVIINDKEEQSFVVELLGRNGMPVDSRQNKDWTAVWIGATDEAKEGEWKWVDGSPLAYANWAQEGHGLKQPNGGPGSHYPALSIHYGGTWDDRSSADRYAKAFICEWDDAQLSEGSVPPQKPLLEGLAGKWDRPNQPDQWHLYANGTAEYRKDDGRLHTTGRISVTSPDAFEVAWENGWKDKCVLGGDVVTVLKTLNPKGLETESGYALERIK